MNNPPTGSVIITGMASQGQVLSASNDLADADGMGAVSSPHEANAMTSVVTTPALTKPTDTSTIDTSTTTVPVVTKLDTGGTVTSSGFTLHDSPTPIFASSPGYSTDDRAGLAFQDGTTDIGGVTKFDAAAAGGPDYIKWVYIMSGSDDMAFSTDSEGVFIHGGSGSDAIAVKSGNNVLDGGTGSNYLVGGSGNDVFFTDIRPAEMTWSTLINFHAGDQATIWGFKAGVSTLHWSYYDGSQSNGPSGASLDINVEGDVSRSGTGSDARITFSGMSVAQASSMLNSTGTIGPNGDYLHFFNQGI